MWVLYDEPDYRSKLRQWLRTGQERFFMAGSEKIAHFTVLELPGREADAQANAPVKHPCIPSLPSSFFSP